MFSNTFEEIERAYREVSDFLTDEFDDVSMKTQAELELMQRIKEETKIKFESSLWIGRYNVDLFSFSLGGISSNELVSKGEILKRKRTFKGLAIEVDGTIHNREFKIRKDNSKYGVLHDLDIALMSISNGDIKSKHIDRFVKNIKLLPRLDSRAKKRLRLRVFEQTIIQNYYLLMNDSDIKEICPSVFKLKV